MKTDFSRKPAVARQGGALRQVVSASEARLWRFLRSEQLGEPFRRQYAVGPYFADYACVPLKLIVDIDGPCHDPDLDAVRDRFMRARGFKVLRFGAEDALRQTEAVAEAIRVEVEDRRRALRSVPPPERGRTRGGPSGTGRNRRTAAPVAAPAPLPTSPSKGEEKNAAGPPWWRQDIHADRRPFLIARTKILAELRRYFATHGFLEVDFGALVPSPGAEVHVSAFATELEDPAGRSTTRYLHTSPEFAAKKLLSAGETRIVSFGHVFRNRERTPLHAPEFTMVEWYRANEPYEAVMADTVALVRAAAAAAEAPSLVWRDRTADPAAEPVRLTVAEAFRRFAGIALLATIAPDGRGDRDGFAAAAARAGVETAPDDTWSDIFARVLAERVEPGIAGLGIVLLTDYPAPEAALARRSPHDPRTAERFELYVSGVEIANGFGELTDPVEQRARFEADMDEKARRYGVRLPIDEELLDALVHMPPASGVALGLDRLVMLATGARHIDQVIWTPLR